MKALGEGSIASWVRIGLGIAWGFLWFLAVCLLLGAIGYGLMLVLVANGTIDPTVFTGGEGHVRVGGEDSTFNLSYDDAAAGTWPVVVPSLFIGGVAIAGALVIVWRLRRLFESFTSGEPFRRENAGHLRAIWITMMVIEISKYLLLALTHVLLTAFGDDHVKAHYSLSVNFSTWGSILILIVLAEVFREGARLKEEQELTI